LLKGNLKVEGLKKVTSSFIQQDNPSKIVIKGRYCSAEGRAQIEELKQKIGDQLSSDELELTQ
jgi:hypothetical protein